MPRGFSIPGLTLIVSIGLSGLTHARPPLPCETTKGLKLHAQADARNSGYLLSRDAVSGYFRQAAYDLVQGRIRFFETEESAESFVRYALADAHDPTCMKRSRFDALLAGLPLPEGHCIAANRTTAADSSYRIDGKGFGARALPRTLSLHDLRTDKPVAHYRRPWRWLSRWRLDNACEGPPAWNLTAFVLPDRSGRRLDPATLNELRHETGQAASASVLPPPSEVRRALAEDGLRLPQACHLPGWMGETEVHVVELERGPLEIEARLDSESEKAGFVILDVHAPDKAVIILAWSHGPTVWHVHESSRTSVVAVLVRGHHGQAVLGLTPFTRILMSTQLHNPYTNCTARELRDIEARVINQYGIARTQWQDPGLKPPVVRYNIGEPMPDGAELFHYDRALADFEVQGSD